MRPRFQVELPHTGTAFLDQLRDDLTQSDECQGNVFRRHAMLQPRAGERIFWSPYLNLEVRERDDGAHIVCARFSPHPSVWTAFMATYAALGFAALAGLVYGGSQAMLGHSPWALLVAPISLALAGFVYGAAFIGQGLGAEQMYELRAVVDRAVQACSGTAASAETDS